MIQSIIAAAKMIGGFRPAELATTIGYLIGIVILIPIAWLWANVERTRFSGIVLAVAAFAVLAMTLRLLVLWTPRDDRFFPSTAQRRSSPYQQRRRPRTCGGLWNLRSSRNRARECPARDQVRSSAWPTFCQRLRG